MFAFSLLLFGLGFTLDALLIYLFVPMEIATPPQEYCVFLPAVYLLFLEYIEATSS